MKKQTIVERWIWEAAAKTPRGVLILASAFGAAEPPEMKGRGDQKLNLHPTRMNFGEAPEQEAAHRGVSKAMFWVVYSGSIKCWGPAAWRFDNA